MAFGGRVCVGIFNANGLKVNDDNDDNDNDNIGRALVKSESKPEREFFSFQRCVMFFYKYGYTDHFKMLLGEA